MGSIPVGATRGWYSDCYNRISTFFYGVKSVGVQSGLQSGGGVILIKSPGNLFVNAGMLGGL